MPNTKLVLVSREPLLYLEFNKPNKQNVYGINSNSTLLSFQIIADTLTDVENANHSTSLNLAFRCECFSPFQGTAASKVQLTSAQSQL